MEPAKDKDVEVQIKVRVFDSRTNTFTEVIGTTAKLSKADVGLTEGPKDEWITICIDPGKLPNYADAKLFVSTHSKSFGAAPNSN